MSYVEALTRIIRDTKHIVVTVSWESEGRHLEKVTRAENLLIGGQGMAWMVRDPQKGWRNTEWKSLR